jgi:transposase-like protein
MAKYSKKTVERIVGLVKSDTYTIAEICRQSGIAQRTYYKWLEDYPDFAAAIEEAEAERMQMMAIEAKKSLLRKLQGYEVVETHVTTVPDKDGKPKIKEQKTIKKHVAADTAAIIFTLTNGDPEHWRNRQSTEVTGKDGKDLFANKTDEELDNEIEELKRKLE